MVQGQAGKGDRQRPVEKMIYDINWMKVFGYCQAHHCKNNWSCRRYCERTSKNNVSYVPHPTTYNDCEFYTPSKCEACDGKGYHRDWDKPMKKYVKTTCILCQGAGTLDYRRTK